MTTQRQRGGAHDNGLGFLRLLFASLVIFGHTPEIADGDRSRELLTQIFGTISFGELAVDCFFLISGYLIVASFVGGRSTASYLKKRAFRIYPAFIVASLISYCIVAPLAGAGALDLVNGLPDAALNIAALQAVNVPNIYVGAPSTYLNASLWTIPYEFRCYLLVILLGWTTILRRPAVVAGLALAGLMVFVIEPFGPWSHNNSLLPFSRIWVGRVGDTIRLTSIFLVGASFYLWRDRLKFTDAGAVMAAIGLAVGLTNEYTAQPAVALFGGYLIFAFAAATSGTVFSRLNNQNDISYGVYLYGWPVGSLILWFIPDIPLGVAMLTTLVGAIGFGWASWILVERPVMRKMTKRAEHVDAAVPSFGDVDTALSRHYR